MQMFSQKPFVHWDNIKKSIRERFAELIMMDKIVFNKDQTVSNMQNIVNIIYFNKR